MKQLLLACLAGAALMACSPSEPEQTASMPAANEPAPEPNPAPPPMTDPATPTTDACGAAQYAGLIGKPITEAGVPAESPDVRYIRPDTQVTMDFRPDRLNIDSDANDVITGFRCT